MLIRHAIIGKALLNLAIGILAAFLFLEILFHVNPTVLPRGLALPFPVDPAITSQTYDVFSSDADLFYWHSDIIKPISPENDQLEARVNYHLDQFGFPNKFPQPEHVDLVVLGRSFSIGAQASYPWVRQVEDKLNVSVLNLAQSGGLKSKLSYLQTYGLPRDPEWVLLEVLPSLDILAGDPNDILEPDENIVLNVPRPVIQLIGRSLTAGTLSNGRDNYEYPLALTVGSNVAELTFFITYLEALSVSPEDLHQSNQWQLYSRGLDEFRQLAEREDFCLALLLAPTKPDVYFPLSTVPAQLEPITALIQPWTILENGDLGQDKGLSISAVAMQQNANDQWSAIQEYAQENDLPFINPIPRMQAEASEGNAPFMRYDSHWSALGHRIVAELVTETLAKRSCR